MKTFKKLLGIMLAALLCLSFVLVGCGETQKPPPLEPPEPEVTLQKIAVTTMPARVDYYVDDAFSAEGGMLTATYSDNTTKEVALTDSSVELSNPDTSTVGTKNVVVRYGGKQTTFKIEVTKEQFTVTFKYNDGATADSVSTVNKGDAAEKPTDPTRNDFKFEGWFIDEKTTMEYDFATSVTASVVLYGKWLDVSKKSYKVTFNYNHLGIKPASVSQTVEEGSTATRLETDPERYGYRFDGWFTAATGGEEFDFTKAITAATNVYAHWTRTLTGEQNYVFEAENTSLIGKEGFATSGSAQDGGMVVQDNKGGVSGVGFVAYLYGPGIGIEFYITSDVEVSGVTIWVRMSAELVAQTYSSDNFSIELNGEPIEYGPVVFSDDDMPEYSGGLSSVEHADFRDVCLGNNFTLVKGVNEIALTTMNNNPPGGVTWRAVAPIIDCIKIKADAVLTWTQSMGLPAYDYKA